MISCHSSTRGASVGATLPHRFTSVGIALFACLLTAGCSGLDFRQAKVVDLAYDDAEQATRIDVRFSVVDRDGLPVNDLTPGDFGIWEDGVRATSESFTVTTGEVLPVGITVLLDNSKSMYDADSEDGGGNAVVEVKRMAREFVSSLDDPDLYDFRFYRFASDLSEIGSVEEVLDAYAPDSESRGERWTALYHAVVESLERHPDNIIVVFSDGADNYSQNRGGVDLREVVSRLRESRTPVFAIGSANCKHEYDRQGISGAKALRRLCRFGALRLATDPYALGNLLSDIHDQVRVVYTLSYYSPNLAGDHALRIRVNSNGLRGKSQQLLFSSDGPSELSPE